MDDDETLVDVAKAAVADSKRKRSQRREGIDRALDEAVEAATREGIKPGDPAHPLMMAVMTLVSAVGGATEEHTQALGGLLTESAARIDTEIKRLQVASLANERDTVRRISEGIAKETQRALRSRVRLDMRMFILCAVGALALGIIGAGVGGYQWGWAERNGELVAAANGVQVTGEWLALIRANDLKQALAQVQQHGFEASSGRSWGAVPLWFGMPKPPPGE